jgi:molybdopterin converting factor small subunit
MRVIVPGQLHAYTGGRSQVQAEGASLAEVLDDLDRRHPGLRFRVVNEQGAIRPHIRFFVNREPVSSLAQPLSPDDELLIVAALSGG